MASGENYSYFDGAERDAVIACSLAIRESAVKGSVTSVSLQVQVLSHSFSNVRNVMAQLVRAPESICSLALDFIVAVPLVLFSGLSLKGLMVLL